MNKKKEWVVSVMWFVAYVAFCVIVVLIKAYTIGDLEWLLVKLR